MTMLPHLTAWARCHAPEMATVTMPATAALCTGSWWWVAVTAACSARWTWAVLRHRPDPYPHRDTPAVEAGREPARITA